MQFLPYDSVPITHLCEELDQWRLRIDYRGPLPRRWAGRLRKDLEAEAVAASTRMEGVPVTVDEVRRILAGDSPPEVRQEDRELVEGYREAMSFVLRRADDPSFRWTRELVVALHDRVLAGRHSEGAGRLRTERPALIVNQLTGKQVFLPPPGEEVPTYVDQLCARMEGGHQHPAMAAAWAHVALAAVHPFRDGNGRTARVSASLAMYRGDFKRPEFTSLEEWWGRHLHDYYAAFECLGESFDPKVDVTPFLKAHIEAQLHQVRSLDARESVERQIWTALEELAEESNLEPRLSNALWDTFFDRQVTAGYYRSISDISPATATKDLSAAVSARLLKAEGHRRARRYLAHDSLFERVGEVLRVDIASPPDAARASIVSELSRRLVVTRSDRPI